MQCIVMENTLIKLTLHDETKKRAHDSQIVRAKENLKLSHGGFFVVFGPIMFKPVRQNVSVRFATMAGLVVVYIKLMAHFLM